MLKKITIVAESDDELPASSEKGRMLARRRTEGLRLLTAYREVVMYALRVGAVMRSNFGQRTLMRMRSCQWREE